MKIFHRYYLLVTTIASLGLLVTSCDLSDELDKLGSIDSVKFKGAFNANLLNETMYLNEVIPSEKLNFKELPDGTYSLGFETSSNSNIANANFPVINIDPINVPLSPLNLSSEYNSTANGSYFEIPPYSVTVEISRPEVGNSVVSPDFKIEEIKLKDGAKINLQLNIANSNAVIIPEVVIPSLTKNNVPYTKTFSSISGSQNVTLVMDDLAGYVLHPEPNIALDFRLKVKKQSSSVTGDVNAIFSLDLSDRNEYVKGFLGETVVQVDPIEVPISLSDLISGSNNGKMIVKEATITLTAQKNGFVIPTELEFPNENLLYYKGVNEGKSIALTRINSDTPDTFKYKIQDIDVLNIEKLVLNPRLILNKGLTSGENVLTDNAFVAHSVNAEVPLDVTVQDLTFEEESDNPFKDVSLEEGDFQILNGLVKLKGVVISELPLGTVLQVYYRNESEDETYLSPLFDTPILINSGTNNFEAVITKEKLDIVNEYPYQVVQLTLNGSGAVKSSQKVAFKVGVAVKGDFKTKI